MNVSIPPGQEHFVRAQVDAGRYRTASEVIREGLRLLEEREHLRLLERSLYEGLSPGEESALSPELLAKARDHIRQLVAEGLRDREAGRISDGTPASDKIRKGLRARHP